MGYRISLLCPLLVRSTYNTMPCLLIRIYVPIEHVVCTLSSSPLYPHQIPDKVERAHERINSFCSSCELPNSNVFLLYSVELGFSTPPSVGGQRSGPPADPLGPPLDAVTPAGEGLDKNVVGALQKQVREVANAYYRERINAWKVKQRGLDR